MLPCNNSAQKQNDVLRRAGCVLAATALSATLLTSCAAQNASTEKEQNLPVLLVGSDDYPPYNYEDADGNPTGIDVDLAEEALRRMGYRAEFVRINWEEKRELVESGAIDCIWGSFSMDGRENDYNWAGPYMISDQVVAVAPDSDIYTLQDLEGKVVAVQSTTKPEQMFAAHTDPRLPAVRELLSLQDRELIYAFLSKGYADAVAAHETAILQYMKDYDLQFRILDEPLLTVGLGVAFSASDTRGLDRQLTETFAEMRADGTCTEILSRYLQDPEKYLEVERYGEE